MKKSAIVFVNQSGVRKLSFANNVSQFRSIATIISERQEVVDDHWGNVLAKIKLNNFDCSAFKNIDYAYFLFYMDLVEPAKIIKDARHPRNNKAFPLMGILAQRAKNRPNQVGMSCAKIIQCHSDELIVQGLDAVDGTPLLLVKPFIEEAEPATDLVKEASWLEEVMQNYFTGQLTEDAEERIKKLQAPKRQSPYIVQLSALGISQHKTSTQRSIFLNPDELEANALEGLELFSHAYIIYEGSLPGEAAKLNFVIGKIIEVEQYHLVVDAPDLPLERKIFDIKPYTKLFFPVFN